MTLLCRIALASLSLSLCALPALAQQPKPDGNDIPATFTPPKRDAAATFKPAQDYTRRVEMIPMRDGVKLYTVIMIPKGATRAPIVLTRTCYNAEGRAAASRPTSGLGAPPMVSGRGAGADAKREASTHLIDELGLPDEIFVKA